MNPKPLSRVLQFVLGSAWALEEAFHRRMVQVLESHQGGDLSALIEGAKAAAAAPDERGEGGGMRVERDVAIIPIRGVIAQRASVVDPACGGAGTSVEHIRRDLQAALANDAVRAIVLEVDSPGGSVAGLADLAADLREARGRKPIVAHTDGMMASAAYWLASQADAVYATRDAQVGSVGVIASFLDNHRALADRGLDPVVIKSTPGKGGVQSNGTFGDANRQAVQQSVDAFHAMFVADVAAGRRIDDAKASSMGDGSVTMGPDAQARGFIDAVRPFAAAVRHARSLAKNSNAAPAAAAAVAVAAGNDDAIDASDPLPPEADVADGNNDRNEPMDPKNITTPATPAPAAATSTAGNTEAMQAERARCTAIASAALPEQRDLAARLVADGTPLAEALQQINADLRVRLDQARTLPQATHAPLGRGNTAQVTAPAAPAAADPMAGLEGEDLWRAQWKADKALRAEFESTAIAVGKPGTGFDLFAASMRNEGRARAVSSRENLKEAGAADLKTATV